MIDTHNLVDDLLIKAKRDMSKLVTVQRPVVRNGKTVMMTLHVLPSEVKKGDRVTGGHQNLIPTLSSLTKPAAGILDMKYFGALEKNDKSKAMDYLKQLGFTWKQNSHEAISWMHAKSVLNKFLNAHPSFKTASGSISGLLGQAQPTSQASTSTQQAAQNNPSSTVNNNLLSSFTAQQQAEINACANGKEKFTKIREILGKDKAVDWAKANGFTWSEHAHEGINIMRLGMAVRDYFDAVDGTVSPGPVPKGTQKPKVAKPQQPAAPKVDPDLIPVPANATERTKKLIEHINKMTSVSDISNCARMGMVPEDDVAKSFILDKLMPNFKNWVGGGAPKSVKDKWAKDTGVAANTLKTYQNSYWGWGDRAIDMMKLNGYKRAEASRCMGDAFIGFNMSQMVSPRDNLKGTWYNVSNNPLKAVSTYNLINNLNYAYSDYTTDEYDIGGRNRYASNMGYTGSNPSEYKKRYDLEKEGFVRYLKKVEKANPALSSKIQGMISTYDETMKIVGGNPKVLQIMESATEWKTVGSVPSTYSTNQFGSNLSSRLGNPTNMRHAVDVAKLQTETVIKELQKRGYSSDVIKYTLGEYYRVDSLSSFQVMNPKASWSDPNKVLDTIDFAAMLPDDAKTWNYASIKYCLNTYKRSIGEDAQSEEDDWVEQAEQIASLTEDDWMKVQGNLRKLAGINMDSTGSASVEQDDDLDKVWSNISLASRVYDMHHDMAITARQNAASPVNNKGNEYSGNYDYYSGKAMFDYSDSKRVKQYGDNSYNSSYFASAKELSDKIQSQLDDAPVLTDTYLDNLKNHYAKSLPNPSTATNAEIAKAASDDTMWKDNWDKVNDDPSKDIAFIVYSQMSKHIPKMNEVANLDQKLRKNFDYVPYDFNAATQPKFNKAKATAASTTSDLRKAREDLLKSAKCSIGTEDDATSLEMRKDFLKRWDYRPGEKTPGGTVMSGRVHSGPNAPHGDQRALFNSRFFAVKNSVFEERFNKEQERLRTASTDPKTHTPLEVFHGTSYGCAPNIIGREGQFFMGDNFTKAGKMLGNGVYVANKGGKSSVYIGNSSYANRQSYTRSGDADGIMMCLTVMRGENYKSRSNGYYGGSSDKSITSLEQDAGTLNDWEMAVKRNELVFPHHFVDISSRVIGKNVTRDSITGEYTDNVSGLSYDKYGTLKGMK